MDGTTFLRRANLLVMLKILGKGFHFSSRRAYNLL